MGMLSGKEIERQRGAGRLVIEPALPGPNPNSFNLRLGEQILLYKKTEPLLRWWENQYAHWYFKKLSDPLLTYQAPASVYGPQPLIEPLDMAVEEETLALTIPAYEHGRIERGGLLLYPGMLYLGHTLEYTETKGYVPCIEGRSSVGRLGMQIHVTAGFGDCQFRGDWCLEITVMHALRVYSGVAVCQIAYQTLEGEETPYAGRYQDQRGPKPSGLWKDFRPK